MLGSLSPGGGAESITIDGGITLLGSGGTGPGTLSSGGGTVAFGDAETLDNVVIAVGTADGFFDVKSMLSLGATATLTVSGAGSSADFSDPTGSPTTLDNAGSIALTGSLDSLEIDLDNVVNSGTITVASGGRLGIGRSSGSAQGTFSNTGIIDFTGGGTLAFDAAISAADLAGITLNGGTLQIGDAYQNAGQTLTTTATGVLSNIVLTGGTIVGGTIASAAGHFSIQSGTFDGVTWNSTLLAPGGQLVVLGGLTLAAGNDTLDLTAGGALLARDSETLDNILVPLGSNADLGTSGTGELALGADTQVTLDNPGTASITGGTVTNAGTIVVSDGDLQITASAFSNTGTIATSGGTVEFGGSFTATSLGSVKNTGGTVEIGGTLVNTGTTLVLPASGTFSNIILLGTIEGGTVRPAGGTIAFIRNNFGAATLAGVVYDGTLDLSAAQSYVRISGSIALHGSAGTGPGAVLLTGGQATLVFDSTTTLDNATITAGNAQSSSSDFVYDDNITIDSALTLGPNLLLVDQGPAAIGTLAGANLTIGGNDLQNAGTMEALAAGGTLAIITSAFSNTGTLSLAAGAVLDFEVTRLSAANLGTIVNSGGTVDLGAGIFTNTGNTLVIAPGGAFSTLLFGGAEVVGGTVLNTGGTVLFSESELEGVTFNGVVDMSAAGSSLLIANGITLNSSTGSSPGSIDLTGAGSALVVTDNETLNAATITIGNAATADGVSIDFGSTLTLGANLLVQETGTGALGVLGGFGTIVNAGTIDAAAVGGGLTINPSGGFSNSGTMAISAGALLALNFVNANAASVGNLKNNGGMFEILGTLDNAGSLLDITAASPFAGGLLDGLLTGGTVAMDGGTLEYAGSSLFAASGTLSSITVMGVLDLSTAFASLFLETGVSLVANGATAAAINETGAGADLIVQDNQTLDNATFTIGNAATADQVNADATLTLGAGLLLTETAAGAHAAIGGSTVVNDGTIFADAAGGGLTLGASNFLGGTGTLSIGAGGFLSVGLDGALSNLGTILNAGGTLGLSGTIVNTGSTLVIGPSGAFRDVLLDGTVEGGTIELAGGVLQFGTAAALVGVTFIAPTIDLNGSGASLWVHPGSTLSSGTAGPVTIDVTGLPTKFLSFDGGDTLSNAVILVSGTAQQLDVGLIAPGTVTFAANTSLDIAGSSRVILGIDINSATLADAGTIHVASTGTLALDTDTVDDTGTISLDPGAVVQVNDVSLGTSGWIGSVGGTGGTLQVDASVLDLGGGTLSIGPSQPFSTVQNFDTIADGTIVNDGTYQAATSVLQDISFDGVLDLSAAAPASRSRRTG